MKLHLPKMLAVAVLCAMAASAEARETVTPGTIVTTTQDFVNVDDTTTSNITTGTGASIEITTETSKNASLYVRDGEVKVTGTKLTLNPTKDVAALSVAGNNAVITFKDATYAEKQGSMKHVGGADGCGTLNFINSQIIGNESELFTIGVHGGYGPSQTLVGNGDDSVYQGTYRDAANGSDNKFGYGEVNISGGSVFNASFRHMQMGEGALNVTEASKVVIGNDDSTDEYYKGFKMTMGVGENTTSEINVSSGSSLDIYASKNGKYLGGFSTNLDDNTTSNITVDGGSFSVNDPVNADSDNYPEGRSGSSYIGFSYEADAGDTEHTKNAVANIVVKNGGTANFNSHTTYLGYENMKDNASSVNISVEDAGSSLILDGAQVFMYEGASIDNSGKIYIDTTYNNNKMADGSMYVRTDDTKVIGGTINNFSGAEFEVVNGLRLGDKDQKVRVNNEGDFSAKSIEMSGSDTVLKNSGTISTQDSIELYDSAEVVNSGTLDTEGSIVLYDSAEVVNSGTLDTGSSYTWVNGNGAMLTMKEGSSLGRMFITEGEVVVDGRAKMEGSLQDFNAGDGEGAQLVFTEDGHLDMGGNSVKLGAVTLVLQKDGHVDQMTSVDDVDFFSNYSSSDVTDETVVVVVGSDGSTSVRQLGNMNYGTFLGGSRNQRAFYNALEAMVATGDAPQWAEALSNTQDAEALEAGIDALSGHEYATAMSSQIEGNMGHLRRLRGAMGKGTALGSYVVSPGSKGAVDEKGNEVMAATPAVTDVRNWRVGVSAFHEETEIDSDARGDGYDRSETGAMLTAEYYMNKDLTLGGALSYGRTNLRTDGAKRRHEDNTRFDVYALYGKKRWSFATSLGLGLHDHELERELADTKVDGYSVNFMQDAAYTVLSGDDSNVQVFGTVESSWNEIDSFSDGMISGASQDAWSTDVTVGLRYNHALPALGNAPAGVFSAQTGVTASIGDIKSGVDMNINGYGYRQESATRNRWGWNLGAGVDVPVRTNMSVYGAVDAVMRGDSNSVDGQIGVKVSF
ncbi:MAG: autotransporter outer membrane beta-barrel domain-containing protein [Akkermansia sp.]|nr:autotransporter outer membrane beta-barrel domain-containing protein [Akkermansia sp.]MBQ2870028.1 autotransporter outer membrane beta-barrel domain-containing protein [Akkermansia sp.]